MLSIAMTNQVYQFKEFSMKKSILILACLSFSLASVNAGNIINTRIEKTVYSVESFSLILDAEGGKIFNPDQSVTFLKPYVLVGKNKRKLYILGNYKAICAIAGMEYHMDEAPSTTSGHFPTLEIDREGNAVNQTNSSRILSLITCKK